MVGLLGDDCKQSNPKLIFYSHLACAVADRGDGIVNSEAAPRDEEGKFTGSRHSCANSKTLRPDSASWAGRAYRTQPCLHHVHTQTEWGSVNSHFGNGKQTTVQQAEARLRRPNSWNYRAARLREEIPPRLR